MRLEFDEVGLEYFSEVVAKVPGLALPIRDVRILRIVQNSINTGVRLDVPANECAARIRDAIQQLDYRN